MFRGVALVIVVAACAAGDASDPGMTGTADAGDDPQRPERPDGSIPDAATPCEGGDTSVVGPTDGHCYMLFLAASSWDSARSACETLVPTAHLATIESAAENAVVLSIVGTRRTWLGASDSQSEGNFAWVTGEPWDAFVHFRAGEPGNGGGGVPGEDCLEMASVGDGEWNDNECFVAAPYVCERP